MKKILVTGGAGFIGSNLVDRLVELKYKVIVLDNFINGSIKNLKKSENKIKIVKIDISKSRNFLKKYFYKVDVVVHLASLVSMQQSVNNPEYYFKNNIIGTFNALHAAKKNKVNKFIYAASASCYGLPKNFPTNENDKIDIKNPYSLTKYLGEELVLHWCKIYKISCTSLRLFNVYGPRSKISGSYNSVFGTFLSQKFSGKPLTVVGNGNQTRDFIYVSDVVDAIISSINKKNSNGQIYNVGSGTETKIIKIANLFGEKFKNIKKRHEESIRSLADIKKIKKILKWKPSVSIEKGIVTILK
jgi:UDP-glucose 4-epimerase